MKGLMSPEGVLMLCVAGLLDLTSTVCAILIAVFGAGAVINYIVEGLALIIMGSWMLVRYSSLGSEGGMKAEEENEEGGGEEKGDVEMPQPNKNNKENKKSKLSENKLPETKLPEGKNIKTPAPKKMVKNEAKALGKKALKRFGLNFLIESIPFVGCVYPANM